MSTIGFNMFTSLKLKYESEIQEAKTTLLIYFTNSVGIGEHPQHLEEMDKLLERISASQDKLDALLKHFSEFSNRSSLLIN